MLIGHQKQWQFLKKSVEIGKIPHGFLFFGPSHLGKKKVALEFIKLLNCQKDSIDKKPCQVCHSCKDIEKGQHPDLLIVNPQNKEIQIAQIRDLSQRLSWRPFLSPFKTAILDQAHLMNQEAQCALLKTLEEPKGNTVLILVTEYPEMLFPTILSRVQKIKLHPLKRNEIENFLSQKGCPQNKIRSISSISSGRPGIAIDFFLNPEKLEIEQQKLADLIRITAPNSDLITRFQYAKKVTQKIPDLSQKTRGVVQRQLYYTPGEILESWLRYFRELLLIESGANSDFSSYPELQKIFKRYSLSKLREILKTLQRINFFLSTTNINPRLALEIIMLEL